jgi:hydroxymethylbilane synthase
MVEKIVLGTRGSDLARAQAQLVKKAVQARWSDLQIETRIIVTSGDKGAVISQARAHEDQEAPNMPQGRKGLFTVEIERALLAGGVDVAVHSAKDLPSEMSPGAEIAAVLPRAGMDDVLVSKHPGGLAGLEEGAMIATGSVRRKHQLLWKCPQLKIVDLHGNVPTRLRKLAENDWRAIVLARAGLERLGLSPGRNEIRFDGRTFFAELLPSEIFLPAGGQGIIALQIRSEDRTAKEIVHLVNDHETFLCLRAEREFLRLLHGDCNSPVGVLATVQYGKMKLRGQLFEQGLGAPREGEVEGEFEDGEGLAAELLRQIARQ